MKNFCHNIDFHTHILPQIDDGAQSAKESAEMLCMLGSQGIKAVSLTPHYYRDKMTVEEFTAARERSLEELMREYRPDVMPELITGCECAMWRSMSGADLSPLCLSGTNMLMCEMPYSYADYITDELEELTVCGYLPVIAHIDRYFRLYEKRKLDSVIRLGGLLFQVNIQSLSEFGVRMKVCSMAKAGAQFILGTDCHGTSFRPPVIKRSLLEKPSLKKHFIPSVINNEQLFLDCINNV